MKNLLKPAFILLIGLGLGLSSVQAQSNDRSKPGPADKPAIEKNQPREAGAMDRDRQPGIMPGFSTFCLIKAVEKGPMKFVLSADFGNDKDGKPRDVFRNEKEKETFDKALQNGSLVDLLSLLSVRAYEIQTAYVATEGGNLVHYYVLASEKGGNAQMNAPRTDQPQLTPEQREKMRQEREKRRKEMDEQEQKK